MHSGGLTALVGREEQLELLLRSWARAKTGEGQVVLLSGEAGIGKSRLCAALMEALTAEPHTRLRYFCSPQHTDSAFYPLIGQFERAAGFAHGDTPQTKLDKLDALLAQTATSRQDAALVAELLSLANDGRYPALELAPEQRRQKTLEALDLKLETLARSSPVLTIVEDAHWGDPTSLEAFGRTVDRIANLPGLTIVTFRPEFEAPWVGQPHVTALALNRLGHREVGSMIDRVVGNKELPAYTLASVQADFMLPVSDGNASFDISWHKSTHSFAELKAQKIWHSTVKLRLEETCHGTASCKPNSSARRSAEGCSSGAR
jgi:predicted ATPase